MKRNLLPSCLVLCLLICGIGICQAQQQFKFRNHTGCDLRFMAVAQLNCTSAYTPLKVVNAGGSMLLEMNDPVTWGGPTLPNPQLWQWLRTRIWVIGANQYTSIPTCDTNLNLNQADVAHKKICGTLAERYNCARITGTTCAPYFEVVWTEDVGNNVVFVDVY